MIWIIEFIFILLDAVFNNWRIRRLKPGQALNHTINVFYRIAFGLAEVEVYHVHGLELIMYGVGSFVAFRLLYNIELNLLQHRDIDTQGKTSAIDRFTRWTGIPWIADTVWSAMGTSIFIYGFYNTNLS